MRGQDRRGLPVAEHGRRVEAAARHDAVRRLHAHLARDGQPLQPRDGPRKGG